VVHVTFSKTVVVGYINVHCKFFKGLVISVAAFLPKKQMQSCCWSSFMFVVIS